MFIAKPDVDNLLSRSSLGIVDCVKLTIKTNTTDTQMNYNPFNGILTYG